MKINIIKISDMHNRLISWNLDRDEFPSIKEWTMEAVPVEPDGYPNLRQTVYELFSAACGMRSAKYWDCVREMNHREYKEAQRRWRSTVNDIIGDGLVEV